MREPLVGRIEQRRRPDEQSIERVQRRSDLLRNNDDAYCTVAQRLLRTQQNTQLTPNEAFLIILVEKERQELADAFQYRAGTMSTFPVPGEDEAVMLTRRLNSVFGSALRGLGQSQDREDGPPGHSSWSGIPMQSSTSPQAPRPSYAPPSPPPDPDIRTIYSSAKVMARRGGDLERKVSPRGERPPNQERYMQARGHRRGDFALEERSERPHKALMGSHRDAHSFADTRGGQMHSAVPQRQRKPNDSYQFSIGSTSPHNEYRSRNPSTRNSPGRSDPGRERTALSPRQYEYREPMSILRGKGDRRYARHEERDNEQRDVPKLHNLPVSAPVQHQNPPVVEVHEILPPIIDRTYPKSEDLADFQSILPPEYKGTYVDKQNINGAIVPAPEHGTSYALPLGVEQSSVGVPTGRIDTSEVENGVRVVQVVAPENLPEGYRFEAQIGSEIFQAMVPKGGVVKGEVFSSPMVEAKPKEFLQMNIPHGRWRDGIFSCFSHGVCHPMLIMSVFFPQVVLVQIVARMKLSPASEKATSLKSRTGVKPVLLATMSLIGLNGFLILYFFSTSYKPVAIVALALLVAVQAPLIFAFLVMVYRTRKRVRKTYNIPESHCVGFEDIFVTIWCMPLALAQIGRHTANYEKYRAMCCSDTGLAQNIEVVLPTTI